MRRKKLVLWILGALGSILMAIALYQYLPVNTSHFTGPVSPGEPLPKTLISELERYVATAMRQNEVPGVSMVLVQGDQVVYAKGLGVRDLETGEPVTTKTLMGIGSTTKSMTAVLIGALVDEGLIAWDTPVTQVLPSFALADPEITRSVTFEHMLCMCTGVPRRMEEITFRYSELSPEEVIESLATIPLNRGFEDHFDYSSRMLAAGGFIAAIPAGGEYGRLAEAYPRIMQERLLDPLEMTSSTFSIKEAMDTGRAATPYYSGLSGYHAIPPEVEGIFTPIAPAGALWSNAEDLGRYLVMLLNHGTAANGRQVISPENLAYLWEPRVAVDRQIGYGLGWHVEDYHGLAVLHHPGGTVGFASELVVIPELDVGFALLTNRLDMVTPLGRMATYRLLEMLTGREQVYDAEVRQIRREIDRQILTLSLLTQKTVRQEDITPFLGSYQHELLGDVQLELHEDRTLWIDVGEYDIPLRPLRLETGQYIVYESIFIGKTLILEMDPGGRPKMILTGDEGTYQFKPSSTVGEP